MYVYTCIGGEMRDCTLQLSGLQYSKKDQTVFSMNSPNSFYPSSIRSIKYVQ